MDGDRGGEGEEAGGKEAGRSRKRAAETRGEGGEGVVAGGRVARRRRSKEGIEARESRRSGGESSEEEGKEE